MSFRAPETRRLRHELLTVAARVKTGGLLARIRKRTTFREWSSTPWCFRLPPAM